MSAVSLIECFASVPDPRRYRSKFYPLPALLGLVTLGLLMGRKSFSAFRRLHQDYGDGLLLALGFGRARVPSKSSFSRLLRRLDPRAVEAALARWVAARLPAGTEVLSLDGKTLRGSKDGEVLGQHLVSAYAPQAQAVLAQLRVDAKTNEHKAALPLLGILPVAGKVVVGDAMFCQRDVARAVVGAGGDYVLTVKDNQPGLQTDVCAGFGHEAAARSIAAAFSPPTAAPGARAGGDERGPGPRPHRAADAADDDGADAARQVAGAEAGLRAEARADGQGAEDRRGGLRGHQPAPRAGRRAAAAGDRARALAHREPAALGARRDAGGGRLPGAQGGGAAGAGGAAQRLCPPAVAGGGPGEGPQPRRRLRPLRGQTGQGPRATRHPSA